MHHPGSPTKLMTQPAKNDMKALASWVGDHPQEHQESSPCIYNIHRYLHTCTCPYMKIQQVCNQSISTSDLLKNLSNFPQILLEVGILIPRFQTRMSGSSQKFSPSNRSQTSVFHDKKSSVQTRSKPPPLVSFQNVNVSCWKDPHHCGILQRLWDDNAFYLLRPNLWTHTVPRMGKLLKVFRCSWHLLTVLQDS